MTSALHNLPRRTARAGLAGALTLALTGTATASLPSPPNTAGGATVVGYKSERALGLAVAESGSRIVRRIPALHVAVLSAPPGALGILGTLPGIRYSRRPVVRHELIDPGIAPEPVLGGAYEWQYAAARESLVPASVRQAASAITIAVIDTGADVSAPDLAAKTPSTWSVRTNSTDVTDYQGHGEPSSRRWPRASRRTRRAWPASAAMPSCSPSRRPPSTAPSPTSTRRQRSSTRSTTAPESSI